MATHRDSNNMVSETTQGKSSAHSQSVKLNVTPASDVISLSERSSSLRRSIRHVKSHAPNPSATAADEWQYSSLSPWGRVTYSISPANVAPPSDMILLSSKSRTLRRSIRHVNAAATGPLTEDAHDAGMHSNNIRWSAVGGTRWGRGTHSQYLQSNVVPANDVIVLP